MLHWTPFRSTADFTRDAANLRTVWPQLHAGDAEPWPHDADVVHAWALFHAGQFEQARHAGLAAGPAGWTAANKATIVYALYLEPDARRQLELLRQAAERAERQALEEPRNPNARFWQAYALGRCAQRGSVTQALAEGLGTKVRDLLAEVLVLEPGHADARLALGTFHAEVIDKVGALVGGLAFGARRDTGLKLFQEANAIDPHSIIGRLEHARALVMLEGDAGRQAAMRLYESAARAQPRDAAEHLALALAQAQWVQCVPNPSA